MSSQRTLSGIIHTLNIMLRGSKFRFGSDESINLVTPNRRKSPNRQRKKRSLDDFVENGSLNEEADIAKGFVNRKGDEVYIIEDVLEYCPKRGYLVKWIGWDEPTWNHPSDMPKTQWIRRRSKQLKLMKTFMTDD